MGASIAKSGGVYDPRFEDDMGLYIQLREEKEKLEAEVKRVAALLEPIQERITERLSGSDDGRAYYGGRTFYVSVHPYARILPEKKEQAARVFLQMGLGEKLSINHQSLTALCREWMGEAGDETQIPETVRECVAIFEDVRLGVRKN
jgi:hypothetical protein